MQKLIRVSVLVMLWASISMQSASGQLNPLAVSPPLPADMKIIPPNSNLPPEISKFSGIWEGTWCFRPHLGPARDVQRAILVIEEIVSPENVRLIYTWGPHPLGYEPGWKRYQGSISQENSQYYLNKKRNLHIYY
jgi:hypothetical protein